MIVCFRELDGAKELICYIMTSRTAMERDATNVDLSVALGRGKVKLLANRSREHRFQNAERADDAWARNIERRGQRADVGQGAAIGFFTGGFTGGGVGAGVGALVGGIVGTVVPGVGNVVGVAVGSAIGGAVGALTAGGVGLGVGAGVAGYRARRN